MQTAFAVPPGTTFDRIIFTEFADGAVMDIDGNSGMFLVPNRYAKEIAELLAEHGVTLTPVCRFVCSKATAYRYEREEA